MYHWQRGHGTLKMCFEDVIPKLPSCLTPVALRLSIRREYCDFHCVNLEEPSKSSNYSLQYFIDWTTSVCHTSFLEEENPSCHLVDIPRTQQSENEAETFSKRTRSRRGGHYCVASMGNSRKSPVMRCDGFMRQKSRIRKQENGRPHGDVRKLVLAQTWQWRRKLRGRILLLQQAVFIHTSIFGRMIAHVVVAIIIKYHFYSYISFFLPLVM